MLEWRKKQTFVYAVDYEPQFKETLVPVDPQKLAEANDMMQNIDIVNYSIDEAVNRAWKNIREKLFKGMAPEFVKKQSII